MDDGGYVQRLQPSAGNSRLETPLVPPLSRPLVTRLIIPSRVRAECLL